MLICAHYFFFFEIHGKAFEFLASCVEPSNRSLAKHCSYKWFWQTDVGSVSNRLMRLTKQQQQKKTTPPPESTSKLAVERNAAERQKGKDSGVKREGEGRVGGKKNREECAK